MTTLTPAPPIPANFNDPAFRADPYPFYTRMRQTAPVAPMKAIMGAQSWLITRYDDVVSALKDPRFSSDPKDMGAWCIHQHAVDGARGQIRAKKVDDDRGHHGVVILRNDPEAPRSAQSGSSKRKQPATTRPCIAATAPVSVRIPKFCGHRTRNSPRQSM